MNEEQLEEICLEWFPVGWEIIYGSDIEPESNRPQRENFKQVVLEEPLKTAIARINPDIPEDYIDDVISNVLKPESLDLLTNNQSFHKFLLEGVPVQYKQDDEIKDDKVFLIDFSDADNNHFQAINQFTVKGSKQHRRPDIICFINGLPLAVFELKSPSDEKADIWTAFNQIQTYKEEMPDLFVFNAINVISDGYQARIGSLSADKERFMPWRSLNKDDAVEWQLETLVKVLFDKKTLLEYMRYFTIFESDGGSIIKKIAGYHQYHAVKEAVQKTVEASRAQGDKKAGVVWHTQGSGKEYLDVLLCRDASTTGGNEKPNHCCCNRS